MAHMRAPKVKQERFIVTTITTVTGGMAMAGGFLREAAQMLVSQRNSG